jgi:hypothetical protein
MIASSLGPLQWK